MVAMIDKPERFKKCKTSSLVHRVGTKTVSFRNFNLTGHISKQGDNLLRKLLVEVRWLGLLHNPWIKHKILSLQRGMKNRNDETANGS